MNYDEFEDDELEIEWIDIVMEFIVTAVCIVGIAVMVVFMVVLL
jgi:hypothetical protein